MPEVEEAVKALHSLTTADLEIMASFTKPPQIFTMALHAVQALRGVEPMSWETARKDLRVQQEKKVLLAPKPSALYARTLANMKPEEKHNGEYPIPTRPERTAKMVKEMLDFRFESLQPKQASAAIQVCARAPMCMYECVYMRDLSSFRRVREPVNVRAGMQYLFIISRFRFLVPSLRSKV